MITFPHVSITPPLVTLATAKAHLHITDAAHDTDLDLKRAQASDVILDYLKAGADPAWTDVTVPKPVQAAILIYLTHLYEDRGDRARETDADADEKVWDAIARLLMRFRDPALA